VAETISGELQATKTDGAARSEANADWVVAIGNERSFGEGTIRVSSGKARYRFPFLAL
jgi:hypothetical protein